MRTDKKRALDLRRQGFSFNEINKKLGIPKSTLSVWLDGFVLTAEAQKRLADRVYQGTLNGLIKRNRMQTVFARERAAEARMQAKKLICKVSRRELLLIGATLYWAEGYKRPKIVNGKVRTCHSISLTNSDPLIVSIFIKFLCDVLKIEKGKIVIEMRLFGHNDSEEAIMYWMKVTSLERIQFRKPQYPISLSSKGKRPYNRLPYGTVQVIVNSTQKFHELMGYIEGIQKNMPR